jgi:hypothetical protein
MEQLQSIQLSFKCPKQLNELQPCNGNWYCNSCNKIVHDFRGMNETQILNIINSPQHPCGIFEANRIEVVKHQSKWLRWVPAAILTFGMGIIQSCTDNKFFPVPNYNAVNDGTVQHTMGIMIMTPSVITPDNEMLTYLYQNLSNVRKLKDTVNIRYTIDEHGSVTKVKILNSKHRSLNARIIKTMEDSPKWMPTVRNGAFVKREFTLSIDLSAIK